jgi:TonB-linked SusC/RagA family outer membrane protein
MEKGTRNGAISDKDGNYSFNVSDNAILKVTYIGFEAQEIKVGAKTLINVVLKTSASSLDEVVVTGYQTLSVNKNTGATKTVKAEVFERKGNSNVLESHEGQVAGLGMSFDPNVEGKKKFDIRGISTIGGNKKPLIVVDGFILEGDISSINPYDIETVTVLKDAAATSIYGARAANGVIVVTSKKGKKGEIKVEYRNSFSYEPRTDLAYRLNRVSSKELVEIQRRMGLEWMKLARQTGNSIVSKSPVPAYQIMLDLESGKITKEQAEALFKNLGSKDNTKQWEKAFYQPKLEMQHNLSISGGGDKNTFRASLNYTKEQKQFVGSKSDKINLNILNHYVFNKKTNLDIIANVVFNNAAATPIDLSNFKTMYSYDMIADKDGNPLPVYEVGPYKVFRKSKYDISIFKIVSKNKVQQQIAGGFLDGTYYPLKELGEYISGDKGVSVRLQARLNTKITKNIMGHFGFQYESAYSKHTEYSSPKSFLMRHLINDYTEKKLISSEYDWDTGEEKNIYERGKRWIPLGGRITETRGNSNSYTLRGQLDFNKIWGDHELSSIIGSEIRHIFSTSTTTDRFGYNPEFLTFKEIDKATLKAHVNDDIGQGGNFEFYDKFTENLNRYFSLYGNFIYRYKNRYVLSGSIRTDQSNLFGTNHKYRYKPFWSVGAKWIISDESFFNTDGILNRFSFKASYGINGNISNEYGPFDIGRYEKNYITDTDTKDNEISVHIDKPKILDLRWERTRTINFGFDLGFLDDKIAMEIDFYDKQTFDLLSIVDGDPTLGFTSYHSNNANINNKGIELSLNTVNLQKQDFKWTTFLIFRYNKNRVTKLLDRSDEIPDWVAGQGYQNIEGYPSNSFWLFDYVGFNGRGVPIFKDNKGNKYVVDYIKKDMNIADATDYLKYAGTIEPIYMVSLSNRITYKRLSLSFMFIGYMGHILMKDSFNGSTGSLTQLENFARSFQIII